MIHAYTPAKSKQKTKHDGYGKMVACYPGISVILPTFWAFVVEINLFSLIAPFKKNFFFCIG